MKRQTVYLSLLLIAGAAGCSPKYDETSPKVAPVTEAVFASGVIEPKDAYTVTSLSDGFILHSYVVENDIVKGGQLLFRLDNRQQNTQVNIARTNEEFAKINAANNSPALLQAREQIDAARIKLETDSVNLGRYEHLYTTNSVSKQDLDNARLNYKTSLANYKSAIDNYNAAENNASQTLAVTKSQLENAVAGNQYFDLVAIGPGKVYQVFKKDGDLVRKGDQVAQIGNPDSLVIDLDVDEGSIAKVQLGQQVLVELNTEKNKTYEAAVSKIYPHFNETSQSYKVEARFVKEMPWIISGTQLQANIIVGRKEHALVIPHAYLWPGNKVLMMKGKKADTVNISTGMVSDDWVEVTGGLTTNDKIVKPK